MKTLFIGFVCMFAAFTAFACPVCEKQQPKLLQGISHGVGPQSSWDYVIIWGMVLTVAFTLYFSIKMLVKPGEQANNHIKRTILTIEDGTKE